MLCDCIMNNHIASPDIDSAATNTIDILCQLIVNAELNSQVQYGIIACWRAAACHLQTISVVLNNAMRCLNMDKLLTNKLLPFITCKKFSNQNIHSTLQWAKSCTTILPLSYQLRLTIILNSLLMFIHITQDKSKLNNLL